MFPHQGYEDRLIAFIDVLVRGGIARGQLIHDRIMVVGPAMIEAYKYVAMLKGTLSRYELVWIYCGLALLRCYWGLIDGLSKQNIP